MAWACVCVCDLITYQSNRRKEKIPKSKSNWRKRYAFKPHTHWDWNAPAALEANKRAIAYESFIIFEISEFSSHLGVVLSADKTVLRAVEWKSIERREEKKKRKSIKRFALSSYIGQLYLLVSFLLSFCKISLIFVIFFDSFRHKH